MAATSPRTPIPSGACPDALAVSERPPAGRLARLQERVFLDRYARKAASGQPLEHTPQEMWRRVADAMAAVEPTEELRHAWATRFYDALAGFTFVPGGRILSGGGTGHHVTYYNCFVIPSPDDSRSGILDNVKVLVEIMARGGGVGVNLSSLRPRGSHIRTVNGTSSGPCAWAELYSVATGEVIQQGGSRRGALMLMLDDDHPDIEEFVTVKRDLKRLTHANLSICVSDAFMDAIKHDRPWELKWQGECRKTLRARDLWDVICEAAWASGEPGLVFIDRYNAESNTHYFEQIRCVNPCIAADEEVLTATGPVPIQRVRPGMEVLTHRGRLRMVTRAGLTRRDAEIVRVVLSNGRVLRCTADHRLITKDGAAIPACQAHDQLVRIVSYDARLCDEVRRGTAYVLKVHPLGRADVYDLSVEDDHTFVASGVCVHNCGEQGLGDWGVCNLGALNLSAFVAGGDGDTPGVFDYDALAAHARVAVRFLDNVVDANEYFIKENQEAQLGTRRVGLGTMGLADALIKLHVPYGSDESLRFIRESYRTIRDAAYDASADLAAEKGAFPRFAAEPYLRGRFIRRLPAAIQKKIATHGIRNAVVLTQAPTGTTSLLAGVSSGIEPVYDFAMVRRDRTGEHVLYHPLLQAWKDAHPGAAGTPAWFVSANDLTPEEHVRVQATVQEFTDSSISKTVNAPHDHTVEQVQELYLKAYAYGCKGITYFRDGCREGVLSHLSPIEEQPQRPGATVPGTTVPSPASGDSTSGESGPRGRGLAPPEQGRQVQPQLKPRPHAAEGITYRMPTPLGTMFLTVTRSGGGQPFEVFMQVGKAGSETAAVTEALGRLISMVLRIPSPLTPTGRLGEVVDQLAGIGGGRQLGFGPNRVRSLPDAVAQVLAEFLGGGGPAHAAAREDASPLNLPDWPALAAPSAPPVLPHRPGGTDLCPECGDAALVYEEGCQKCHSCGYSAC